MKKFRYHIVALLTLTMVMSSCQKFIDVNTNPNAPITVDPSALLAPMLSGMVRGVWYDSRYTGQYAQVWGYYTANNVWDEEGYVPASDSGGEVWRSVYFSLGQNITLMWSNAIPNNKYDYIAVGWAMRAWGWQIGADEYNSMIVKEAFDPTRLTFDYDSPQVAYAEAAKDAQLAINYFNIAMASDHLTTSSYLAKGDIMYYGDRTKWIKFCYALLSQNALRYSNKSTFNPDLVSKYADSSFVSNADNASVKCGGTQSADSNFWGTVRGNIGVYRQSDFMVRLLDGRIFTNSATPNYTLDPRLPQLLAVSADGTYRGVIGALGDPNFGTVATQIPYLYGVNSGVSYPAAGSTQKYIFSDNSRGVLMTYPEVQFFKAEALFKKGDMANAYTAYKNGIAGSIDFVSNPPSVDALTGVQNYISATAKANYLAGPCVKQSAATLTISDIMQQKFISLFVWGNIEAWVDIRKYQYDTSVFQGYQAPGTLYPDNAGKQVYLLRPRYNSEYIWNIPALTAIGAEAPDYHTVKPWFVTTN